MPVPKKKYPSKYVKGSPNPTRRKQLMDQIAAIYDKYRGDASNRRPFPPAVKARLEKLLKERDTMESGGKVKKYNKGGAFYKSLDAAEKEVYRRGLAAALSDGNRVGVDQHGWATARVKSEYGKKEAANIRAGKGKKK
jgi:hypothetical protein